MELLERANGASTTACVVEPVNADADADAGAAVAAANSVNGMAVPRATANVVRVVARDSHGRLLPGSKLSPGRPRTNCQALHDALRSSLSPQIVKDIIATLVSIVRDTTAKKVDRIAAAKELLNRCVGSPLRSVDARILHGQVEPIAPDDVGRQQFLEIMAAAQRNGRTTEVMDALQTINDLAPAAAPEKSSK